MHESVYYLFIYLFILFSNTGIVVLLLLFCGGERVVELVLDGKRFEHFTLPDSLGKFMKEYHARIDENCVCFSTNSECLSFKVCRVIIEIYASSARSESGCREDSGTFVCSPPHSSRAA